MSRRARACFIGGGGGLALWFGISVASTRLLATLALTLAVAQLVTLVAAGLAALLSWGRIAPQVKPLLQMFVPPPTAAQRDAGGESSGRVSSPPAQPPEEQDGL